MATTSSTQGTTVTRTASTPVTDCTADGALGLRTARALIAASIPPARRRPEPPGTRALAWACALAILAAAPQHLAAQATGRAPVLLLADLAFDGQSANAVQPGDAAVAGRATAELRRALMGAGAVTLADSAGASAAMERADQPGFHCSANAACMRDVGQRLGATWVVTGRVSKISNLIWYLSAQLVDVTSGSVLLSESLELKGERDDMVPRGAVSMARRIARAAGRGAATP